MKMRGITLGIFCLFIMSLTARATHIVGGALTYEHMGGSTYRITFKMYRDCGPGNANFPSNLNINVYTGNGTSYSTISIPFVQQDILDPPIDTCAFDPGICVSQAIYSTVANNLFPGSGGYHLVFPYCCRNWSLTNIPSGPPVYPGSTYHTYIPDNSQFLSNSSALWVNFPPVFVCGNQPLNFDHSATDQDGDSLSYKLYHPFENDPVTWVATTPPTAAPAWPDFGNVAYNPGYGPNSPLQPSSPTQTLEIDPVTGIMNFATGASPVIGQHVVGIMVEEWRNGSLINIVYRDFQFNVLNCPPPLIADIGPIDACNGQTITLDNLTSGGGTSWDWDFGDGNGSTQFEPTHTYAGSGPFTVTLIADPGSNCADTVARVIEFSTTTPDFNYTDSTCIQDPVDFFDQSSSSANSMVNQWSWDFGDGVGTSTIPNPTYTYTTGGNYMVQLIATSSLGCIDSISYPIFVQDFPTVQVGPDTTACENNPLITLNGSVFNASGGLWVGQGGSFTPNANTLNAGYTPSATEIANDTSMLILTSTGNGFCPAGTDTLFIVYVPGPTVNAGPDVQVCKDTAMIPLTGTVTVAGGGEWTTLGSGSFSPAIDDLNASYIPSMADTMAGNVTIILTSTFNGNCVPASDTMIISFFDPPTVNILSADSICTTDAIALNGNSTTGSGFWETTGSGSFVPSDSLMITSYVPSPADEIAGQVTLIFHTLNNGGCQQRHDTITVTIIESPSIAFSFTDVCFGEVTNFSNSSSSPDGISGYEWNFGDGNGSTAMNPSYTFGTEGPQNVSLIAFSNNGCSDTLTQAVPVHYLPDVGFYNSTPCLNGGSQFIDTSSCVDTTIIGWEWTFGDGNSSMDQNPLNVYASAGTYSVTLIATSAYGCVDSTTANTTVLPGPNADFIADNYAVNLFEQVNFTDQSTPSLSIVDWYWDFGDGDGTSMNQNPSYSYDSTSTFPVLLVVTDSDGCMDSIYKDIVVFMPPLVPSGFTPNGDGQNDVLYVLGGPYKELEFKVYNNWGELIFESNDQSIGWDGTFEGIDQPIGVYVYTVRAVTEDDETHELSGDVTLLR